MKNIPVYSVLDILVNTHFFSTSGYLCRYNKMNILFYIYLSALVSDMSEDLIVFKLKYVAAEPCRAELLFDSNHGSRR